MFTYAHTPRPLVPSPPRPALQASHVAWEGFDVQEMREHLAALPNHNKK